MKYLLALLALLLSPLALAAPWQVDPAASSLGFTGSYEGEAFHGVFKQFQATIDYDQANLAAAKFDVRVQLASVDTQAAERDQTLIGSDFFNTDQTPTAHFVSTGFQQAAGGQVTATGTLTLHGISKPVTLQVHFTPTPHGATLQVAASVQRADWQLGTSNDWAAISPSIQIEASLKLTR